MSEEKAVWYKSGDRGTCKTCGGDVISDGTYWLHLTAQEATAPFHFADTTPESVKRNMAIGEASDE